MNKIYTSYFYQIRNFKTNMIPVSVVVSDPIWYRPPKGKEYYFDKRGIICGLRYEPLIVQKNNLYSCPCKDKQLLQGQCFFMDYYKNLLKNINFEKVMKALNHCANHFALLFKEEPIIVLMLYEAPNNLCSERLALQNYFNSNGIECKELIYPIK